MAAPAETEELEEPDSPVHSADWAVRASAVLPVVTAAMVREAVTPAQVAAEPADSRLES